MAILLLAIFVLPAGIAGAGFYLYAKKTVTEEVEYEIALVATHEANQIENWIGEREFDLAVVGRVQLINDAVRGALAGREGMADSLVGTLRRARQFFGDRYLALDVCDLNGSPITRDDLHTSAEALATVATGATAVSLAETEADSNMLYVYAPVGESGTPPVGALRAVVSMTPLFDILGRTLISDGVVRVYDAHHRLLARRGNEERWSDLPDDAAVRDTSPRTELGGTLISTNSPGDATIGVRRSVGVLNWEVLIERDRDQALAGLWQLRRVLWSVMAIVLIFGGGLAVFISNLTVRKLERREQELQATHEQLITADRLASVGMMAASLAHEINNPLTTIKVLIHSLRDRVSPNKSVRSDVSIVLGEIDKIKSLILRFLQFARPRDPEFTAVDLDETLTRIASLIRHQAQSQGILIFEDYDHSVGSVWADSAQIGQVFLNILLNALDATPVGGEIHINTALARDDRAVVTITNSGPGLPDEIRERIFEPFFSTKATGTGLGLSIARTIVEKHRGQVYAQGHGENGTTFTIILHRAEGEAAHDASRTDR